MASLDKKDDFSWEEVTLGEWNWEPSCPAETIDQYSTNTPFYSDPMAAVSSSQRNEIDEHLLSLEEVTNRYATSVNLDNPATSLGLDSAQADRRLASEGRNVIKPIKQKSQLRLFFEELLNFFNVLLIIAGILQYIILVLSYADNRPSSYLGSIFIAVALLNAAISFIQNARAAAAIAAFLKMVPQSALVIRDGKIASVDASELVKGDIVRIKMGDKIPADLLVFYADDFQVDNSTLTGESEPQVRTPFNSNRLWNEATNLVFNSTLCVSGECYGIVIRTGDNTVIGSIANLTGGESGTKSPLSKEIARFCRIIAIVAVITALIFFGVSQKTYKGRWGHSITFAISILVAWVPEGAPATVTLLLSIAARRMAARGVLVKSLQGVETLGGLTLLATDKTGTLTKNEMTVVNIWTGQKLLTVPQAETDSEKNATQEARLLSLDVPGMTELLTCSALCSKVDFDTTDRPVDLRTIFGDATETGLAKFAAQYMPNGYDSTRVQSPKVFEIPFNSVNKWQLSIHHQPHPDGHYTLYIKGAPEKILDLCSHYISTDGKTIPLEGSETFKKEFEATYDKLAAQGHRILAFAQFYLPNEHYPLDFSFQKEAKRWPQGDYTFAGLISLEDPPKTGVKETVSDLRNAGIRIMMVTGDHPKTAVAVARKTNIIVSEHVMDAAELVNSEGEDQPLEVENVTGAIIVHGEQIGNLTDAQWEVILAHDEIVFARTSPANKLEVVKQAQGLGHIVGMTGDGVNDSPALKRADLGIAMNKSGSDASKSAATMVLLDDNFASVVAGVQEGRTIFANLKRSLMYTLTHTTPEVIPILLHVLLPMPLPLSAILIVVVDLGFDVIVGLSFAWDRPIPQQMRMWPRQTVSRETISARRKRKVKSDSPCRPHDTEKGCQIGPGALRRLCSSFRLPLQPYFAYKMSQKTTGETLIDLGFLSYAIEVGLISAISVILSFFLVFYRAGFTPSEVVHYQKKGGYFTERSPSIVTSQGWTLSGREQEEALAMAQGMAYLSIFITQSFNVFAVKVATRQSWPFTWHNISNFYNFLGILGGAVLAVCIVYIAPFQNVFGASHRLLPYFWLVPVVFGLLILLYASLRRLCTRTLITKKFVPQDPRLQEQQQQQHQAASQASRSVDV